MKTLPKEWYVRITTENVGAVREFFTPVFGEHTKVYSHNACYGWAEGDYQARGNPDGYLWKEISFEQFERFVLEKEPNYLIYN